ncbi:uncharacterized protein LOC143850532 [Tasmannia lanceolata]|uniref:uncharacterized protein LOC143850532 n=1 Tax=Tasmannia lanceolata TaxID=3420 RepID=UPI0040636C78
MGSMRKSWFLIFIFSFLFHNVAAKHEKQFPSAMVVGTVYCDTCFHQEFSKTSHFISGASVALECGEMGLKSSFRKLVKTNEHGEFKVHLPFAVGKYVKRIKSCSVKLLGSSEPYCAVASKATSSSLHLKSRKEGIHIFSAGFFTFKPLKQPELCYQKPSPTTSSKFSSMKTLLPNFPTFPPLSQSPPMQNLPPSPQVPTLPTLPTLPPMINLPPIPQLPQLPSVPTLPTPPPLPILGPVPKQPSQPTPAQLSNQNPSQDKKTEQATFFFLTPTIPFIPSPGLPLPPIPLLPPPSLLPPNPLLPPPSLLPPNPLLPPPSLLPPNPFQPPPSLLPPNPLQPPPSILPPNPFQPTPTPPFFNFPPIPGITPPSPPPPVIPFPFPPIFPGIPPASPSKKTSP